MGTAVLAVATLLVGLAAGAWLQRVDPGIRSIDKRLSSLGVQVGQVQRTQTEHRESLDRRMSDVEQAAGRAEEESRMVSAMLSADTGLTGRVDRLERSLRRRRGPLAGQDPA